jgi:glutamate/tyrosine decarboxylase-like PLP-dependent enzyme
VVPEIVLPRTAHPAFHKAAHYLGLNVRLVEFDPATFRAVPAEIEAAIGPDTIALVVSAPNYSHGVVDPVPAVAALAAQRGLWCHVDACVGGLHLSVMRTMGLPVPAFDWTVPGVSSISVDLHKYGYAAKNASVVMFRRRDLRRFAVFACADTTGYAVLNTTVTSSRTAGPLAAAWAALRVLALPGYQAIVREVQAATRRLVDGVSRIEGLRVLAEPDMCMFSVAADPAAGDPPVNVFALEDEMARRGWYLQAQFSSGASPANLHFSVSRSNVPHVDRLLAELAEAVAVVRRAFGAQARAMVERLTREASAALSAPGPEAFAKLAALAGLTGDALPEGFATVNTVLDALPDAAVDALLAEYLNQLYV